MTLEIKNAFEYIAGKVEAQLAPAGYTRQKVAADDKQEIVALFTSENVAYSVDTVSGLLFTITTS